jgi:hypothetical protein
MTPMIIVGNFPWVTHRLVWDDPRMAGMHCEACGLNVRPEMYVKDLIGPCSAGARVAP